MSEEANVNNPVDPETVAVLRKLGPGPIGDALLRLGVRDFVVSPEVRPVFCPGNIAGPAVTIKQVPTRGQAGRGSKHIDVLYQAESGSVVIFDTFRRYDVIIFGGRSALIAKMQGLEAVVIDGAIRDSAEIEAVELPVFACALPPATVRLGEVLETQAINAPIACGGVLVNPGDLVVGDRDGLVIVPVERAREAAELADQLDAEDKRQLEMIRAGLPRESWYR
jgi:4-hydroxy-4-methyl-2-oxoglutarate aldolase